jgi:alpha-L-fucosidase
MPQNIVDDSLDNYWAADDSVKQATFELDLGGNTEFNLIELQEELSFGQRVDDFQIEVYEAATGAWKTIVKGKTIGYKKADRFAKVTASKLRLTIASSLASPTLKSINIYYNPY